VRARGTTIRQPPEHPARSSSSTGRIFTAYPDTFCHANGGEAFRSWGPGAQPDHPVHVIHPGYPSWLLALVVWMANTAVQATSGAQPRRVFGLGTCSFSLRKRSKHSKRQTRFLCRSSLGGTDYPGEGSGLGITGKRQEFRILAPFKGGRISMSSQDQWFAIEVWHIPRRYDIPRRGWPSCRRRMVMARNELGIFVHQSFLQFDPRALWLSLR
jgi:hypothetical protein